MTSHYFGQKSTPLSHFVTSI